MKKLLMAALIGSVAATGFAQDDKSEVILPLEAQTCNLPTAPARIPDNATYDDLVKAKGNIGKLQADLKTYRECLDKSKANPDLTDGNKMALTQAYNYTVDMEERIAGQFNEAVRAYKAAHPPKDQ